MVSERKAAGTATPGEAIARVLAAAGVRRIYAVPGESYLEVLDAAAGHGLTLVSTRHESGAAFMAEAEAKLTGVPAVAAGTRGVGASNLAIGVHTALQDSTPMIVLVGQVDTSVRGREAFQEVDLTAFYRPITKWAATAHRADRVPDVLAQAVVRATTGRPGPALVALPADLFQETVEEERVRCAVRVVTSGPAVAAAAEADVDEFLRRLAAARRPVVIAGEGARAARAELVEFAERFGVGVYAAFRRQDVFPNDHPCYLGHLAIGVPDACLAALEAADLAVVLGSRLDEITTQTYRFPLATTELVRVDADPAVAADGTRPGRAIVADVGALLRRALERPAAAARRDWSAAHESYVRASTPAPRAPSAGVDPADVLAAMARALPADVILASDAGNFSAFLHLWWRYTHPRAQLAPANGAMGYGVPAAIAAALAGDGRLAVGVCGDGGFLMTGQELETAVRHRLELLVLVFRNGMHGTIAMHQARAFGRLSGVDIGPVDLAGFARSLGARGFSVSSARELDPALGEAVRAPGVRLIDIQTDADLISPAARLSQLVAAHRPPSPATGRPR